MEPSIDLNRLQDYFDDEDIEWKPIATSKKTGKALAAAYITNRAIMDRLDEVCGPANWKNEYQPGPGGGVICGISIRVPLGDGTSEWVTKWDGSENTDVQAVKGGLSTSMRRAAVQWGIGRYIYRLPQQWVPMDQYGRFSQTPRMPAEYLPRRNQPVSSASAAQSASQPAPAPQPETRSNGAARKKEDSNRNSRRPVSDADMYRAAS